MAHILSVNSGSPAPTTATRSGVTGIGKHPVDHIDVRAPGPQSGGLGSGVVGDYIGSRQHHGGDNQAVYAVAREQLDWWGRELGRELPNGMFGENLTTVDLDVDEALVGEGWAVGETVVLAVTAPRVPCQTFATRMGEPQWVKRFTLHGRPGAYLAVEAPGVIEPGDPVRVVHRPAHGIGLPVVFRAWNGDLEAAERVLGAACMPREMHDELADRVARRRPA